MWSCYHYVPLSKKEIPKSKVKKQAFKVCLEFQYMESLEEIKGNKRPNDKEESGFQSKKMKLDYSQDEGERSVIIGLTSNFQKPYGKSDKSLPATIDDVDDKRLYEDKNYDLDYDETYKSYRISKKPKHAELHHKIAELMTDNNISGNVTDKRKCIHILVELPHRSSPKSK